MAEEGKYTIKKDLDQALINKRSPDDIKANALLHMEDYAEIDQAWIRGHEGTFDLGLGEEFTGKIEEEGKEPVLGIIGHKYIRRHREHYKNAKSEVDKLKEELLNEYNPLIESAKQREASAKEAEKKAIKLKKQNETTAKNLEDTIKSNKKIAIQEAKQEAASEYEDKLENVKELKEKLVGERASIEAERVETQQHDLKMRQAYGSSERDLIRKYEDLRNTFEDHLVQKAKIEYEKDNLKKSLIKKLRSPTLLDDLEILIDKDNKIAVYKNDIIKSLTDIAKDYVSKAVELENKEDALAKKWEDYLEEHKEEVKQTVAFAIAEEVKDGETKEISKEEFDKALGEIPQVDEELKLPEGDFTEYENQDEESDEEKEIEDALKKGFEPIKKKKVEKK